MKNIFVKIKSILFTVLFVLFLPLTITLWIVIAIFAPNKVEDLIVWFTQRQGKKKGLGPEELEALEAMARKQFREKRIIKPN